MRVKSKKIALYSVKGITDIKQATITDLDSFIADVRSGRWQDPVLKVRTAKTEKAKKDLKETLPCVTTSGIFLSRTDATLETHSGFVAIDIDSLEDARTTRNAISKDPFIYAVFISCSGTGLCALVKVDPKAHKEAYSYMSEHFYKNYDLHTDPKCSNLSRIRFVSYDPDATLNPLALVCPAKPASKSEYKIKPYLFKSEDFERILKEVEEKEIDLTATYNDWMLCALSLINKFEPDTAREYYHLLSTQNPEYDPDKTDKKFDHLLQSNRGEVPIDWLYGHVEKNGIKAYGKETEQELMFQIVQSDEDRDPAVTPEFIRAHLDEMPTVTKVKTYLKGKHKEYVRNEFNDDLTADGIMITDLHLNSFYIDIRERIDDGVQFDLVKRILQSDFVKSVHPFKEFIQKYLDSPPAEPTGHIDRIIQALVTETSHADLFIKKWLVSMVASAFGTFSDLVLVFCGPQDTGKTEWFRRILPDELSTYRASLNWSGDKDEIIRMSRNLIMLDDEMGGKSMREEKQIKKITSIDKEQTRGAYKSMDQYYHRAAIFCGTTNDEWILSDPTGNRRFLPVYVNKMNFELFNSVDKGLLFYELYAEWKNGYSTKLSKEEQLLLNEVSERFTKPNMENELIAKYLALPAKGEKGEYLTATDIVGYLRMVYPWAKVNMTHLGGALQNAGFVKTQKRINGARPHVYYIMKVVVDFENLDEEI